LFDPSTAPSTVTTSDEFTPTSAAEADWRMASHWPQLTVAMTEQAADTSERLLRGLEVLVQRGRLSHSELQVLANPAQRLRQSAMRAQQIVRLQSGRVRQSHEKIDLAYVVESVLQERRSELAMLGITVRRKFKPSELLIDPTVAYSLVQAMLDWCLTLGDQLELRLDWVGDPARVRLWIKVTTAETPVMANVMEDNLSWLLLRQMSVTDGGVDMEREVMGADAVTLSATFRRSQARAAAPDTGTPVAGSGLPVDMAASTTFKTITGSYVLVCSALPDTRLRALDVVKKLGVAVDGVASAGQALAAYRDRSVDLLVLDEVNAPADLPQLLEALAGPHAYTTVLRLTPAGSPAAESTVPMDRLEVSLGSAVMFALSD